MCPSEFSSPVRLIRVFHRIYNREEGKTLVFSKNFLHYRTRATRRGERPASARVRRSALPMAVAAASAGCRRSDAAASSNHFGSALSRADAAAATTRSRRHSDEIAHRVDSGRAHTISSDTVCKSVGYTSSSLSSREKLTFWLRQNASAASADRTASTPAEIAYRTALLGSIPARRGARARESPMLSARAHLVCGHRRLYTLQGRRVRVSQRLVGWLSADAEIHM